MIFCLAATPLELSMWYRLPMVADPAHRSQRQRSRHRESTTVPAPYSELIQDHTSTTWGPWQNTPETKCIQMHVLNFIQDQLTSKYVEKWKTWKHFKKNSRSQQIKNFRHAKTPIPQIQSCSFKFLQFNSTQIQPTTTQSSALPQYPAVHAGNSAVLLWWVHIQRCSDLKIGLHFVVEGKFMKIHGVFVFLFFRIVLNLFNSSEFISSNSHCK